jgi:hypothetical protein
MKIFIEHDNTGGFSLERGALVGTHKHLERATAKLRSLGVPHIKLKYYYDRKNAIKEGEIKREA